MLHDGAAYRFYAFKARSNTEFYQGAFNPATRAYEYGFNSIAQLTVTGIAAGLRNTG